MLATVLETSGGTGAACILPLRAVTSTSKGRSKCLTVCRLWTKPISRRLLISSQPRLTSAASATFSTQPPVRAPAPRPALASPWLASATSAINAIIIHSNRGPFPHTLGWKYPMYSFLPGLVQPGFPAIHSATRERHFQPVPENRLASLNLPSDFSARLDCLQLNSEELIPCLQGRGQVSVPASTR